MISIDNESAAGPRIPLLQVAGIKAYGHQDLLELMTSWGEPQYRVKQIEEWLYAKSVTTFDSMTNLSAGLRDRLKNELSLPYPTVIQKDVSADGTRKYLLALADGTHIETVGLPSQNRLTVCFSTQAGCAMGCLFCATGKEGLTRSLAPGEMVDQVNLVAADFGIRVSNVVAMGQGEPFANYDALISALRFMNAENILGVGARHITVSTCGLLPMIRRFSSEPEQFTLAVSLHSAIQKTRDLLMPAVARYTLEQLRQSLQSYSDRTGRRVSLEYALIKQVNDTDEELQALVSFCTGLLCHVNLIPLNDVSGAKWLPSAQDRFKDFAVALGRSGVDVSVRRSRGADILGACGQLKAQRP